MIFPLAVERRRPAWNRVARSTRVSGSSTSGANMKRLCASIVLVSLPIGLGAATIPLTPQPDYPLLGVSCGGVHTSTYVTGFDLNGNIKGEVYAWTRCGHSGRGAGYQTATYSSSWHSIVWDLTGSALTTTPWDGVTPDPLFVATDANSNTIRTAQTQTASGVAYLGILSTPQAATSSPATGTSSAVAPQSPSAGGGGLLSPFALGAIGVAAGFCLRRRWTRTTEPGLTTPVLALNEFCGAAIRLGIRATDHGLSAFTLATFRRDPTSPEVVRRCRR